MISDLEVLSNGAGLPVVAWRESRGLHSPEALRLARVECRILKDATTGVLLFGSRGTVRSGSFEEAKPWEQLTGFDCQPAHALYYSSTDLIVRRTAFGKSKTGEMIAHDGAQVLRALFGQTVLPIHINCADASALEIEKLQAALRKAFLEHRNDLVRNRCKNVFHWPVDDNRVGAYDPQSRGWPRPASGIPARILRGISWLLAVAIVAGAAAAIFWLLQHPM